MIIDESYVRNIYENYSDEELVSEYSVLERVMDIEEVFGSVLGDSVSVAEMVLQQIATKRFVDSVVNRVSKKGVVVPLVSCR